MNGLIIKKEWLDLICNGEKVFEMRSYKLGRENNKKNVYLVEAGTSLVRAECIFDVSNGIKYDLNGSDTNEIIKKLSCVSNDEKLKKWCYAWHITKLKVIKKPFICSRKKGQVSWIRDVCEKEEF